MLRLYSNVGSKIEIGVDEAGRGPLLGPVFAAAAILDPKVELHPWLDDSKKLSRFRRKIVRKWIEDTSLAYHVSYVTNDIIDQINIRKATFMAMEIAVKNVIHKIEDKGITKEYSGNVIDKNNILLVIDGDFFPGLNKCIPAILFDRIPLPSISSTIADSVTQVCVIRADATYANVAAASILAKEYHDEYIQNLLTENSELQDKYGLETNMGYGTFKHIQGLKNFGPTKFHRQTFLTKILKF